MQVRGTAYSVLRRSPQLFSLVMPHFDAMTGHMQRLYGHSPPEDFEPSPALPGQTDYQGRQMFRVNMEVAWRLLQLGNGKYVERSFEQCLEKTYRNCFPGKESRHNRVFHEQDCSGDGWMFFDPQNGGYIKRRFTEEQKQALFDYSRKDKGILMSNGEFLSPAVGTPLTMFLNPSVDRVTERNDNSNVVDALNSDATCNVHNLECLVFLKIISYISGVDIDATRVRSENNDNTDPGSRDDLAELWEEQKKKWEEKHKKLTYQIEVPPELEDITDWVIPTTDENVHDRVKKVCRKVLAVLKYWGNQDWHQHLRVPAADVERCMLDVIEGKPMPKLNLDEEDFKEQLGPSAAREQLFKQKIVTRNSLKKQTQRNPKFLDNLKAELNLSSDVEEEEVFNVKMEKQNESRKVLWVDSDPSTCRIPPPVREPATVVPMTAFVNHSDKVRVGELCGGQATFMKASRDSAGGSPVIICEHNPRHRENNKTEFPDCKHLKNNKELTTELMEQLQLEGITGGMPCQEHSRGNRNRQGNRSSIGTGRDYEEASINMAAAYGGKGLPFGVFECSPGVLQPHTPRGKDSAYNKLMENAGHYHDAMGGKPTKANEVKSPLTGEIAPAHHERSIATLLNHEYFPKHYKIKLKKAEAKPDWGDFIDHTSETRGRYIMPEEDFSDFVFEYKKRGGVAYIGEIPDRPPGHGEGAFPSIATDPKLGQCLTFTGGGGKWILVEFNNKPALALVNNAEVARVYYLRGLPDEWLDPQSEFGRLVISHAVLQTVGDAVMVSIFELYIQLMTLKDSNTFGYSQQVSPQEVFKHKAFGIAPPDRAKKINKMSRGMSENQTHSAAAMRKRKALLLREVAKRQAAALKAAAEGVVASRQAGAPINSSWGKRFTELYSNNTNSQPQPINMGPPPPPSWKKTKVAQRSTELKPTKQSPTAEQCICPNGCDSMAVHFGGLYEGLCEPCTGFFTPTHCGCSDEPDTDCCVPTDPTLAKIAAKTKGSAKAKKKTASGLNSNPSIKKKVRGKKCRPKVTMTDSINARIDHRLANRKNRAAAKKHDQQTQHYIDFMEANHWDPLLQDPTSLDAAIKLKRWIACEVEVFGIKGSSVDQKCTSVDKFHTNHGKLPPFKLCQPAMDYITELKHDDKPSQPKIPVPPQIIDLHELSNSESDEEVIDECDSMSTGHGYCLRSIEYLGKTQSRIDPRALHYRDASFKVGNKRVEGEDVAKATKLTLSILSSKNAAGRCTRTLQLVEGNRSNAPRRLRDRYLREFRETGKIPDPNKPIFQKRSGKLVTRTRVTKIIQDLLVSTCGIPKELAGSHSLRRGGASCYRAMKDKDGKQVVSDEDVKRFGRWTSDAYKLYIHVHNELFQDVASGVANGMPYFELN